MRLLPWDPDIQTVISRIDAGALDLQPDFQRGEVWSKAKKQRLVDSVLRDWHVPPIHVIENPSTKRQEVLDGQQRLAAIRDFSRGEFAVDGQIEPYDEGIARLSGLKYRDLPEDAKRQFDQFTLRIYRIVDFKTTEPAELFFRLNQPTNLTGAEQRNAFFGPVREQVKGLVELFPKYGIDKSVLGFSNSRMAYDDVLCRVVLTLKRKSLSTKIAANDLVELYRGDTPIDQGTLDELDHTLSKFGAAAVQAIVHPRFNKATAYSWLIFISRVVRTSIEIADEDLAAFMAHFESERVTAQLGGDASEGAAQVLEKLLSIYDDRATSRVADVSSIILRDIVIWIVFAHFMRSRHSQSYLPIDELEQRISSIPSLDGDAIAKLAIDGGWGNL